MATAPATPATTPEPRDWDHLIAQADRWVREVLGKYEEGKELRWETVPGPPSVARLTLIADGHSTAERFYPDELADRREVRWKAFELWGHVNNDQLTDEFRGLREYIAEWREELDDGRWTVKRRPSG